MGWGVRSRRVALTAAVVDLVVGTAALASGSAVPVTLRLAGPAQRDVGQSARLIATAKLPAGAHLLIQSFSAGKAPAKVADCLRSPCTGSYRDAKAEKVNFQAFAIRRSGTRTTILGRSKRIAVTWTVPAPSVLPTPATPPSPPAPPAPAPAATPGHYEGKTADNELWRFDVTADGRGLTNLQTGQWNEHCEPPAYLSGGDLRSPGPYSIALDGSFSIKETLSGTVGGSPSTDVITITGRISGGTASGTYRGDTSFTGYNCTTGDQTWTATRVG